MATTVTIGGNDYQIPSDGERDWAAEITAILVALSEASGSSVPELVLGAAGGTANAEAATYDSGTGTLTLRPASASYPGLLTAANYSKLATINGTNTRDVTIGSPAGGLSMAANQVLTQAAATVSAAGSLSAFNKENLDSLGMVSLTGGGVTADITAAITEAQGLGLKRVHLGDGTWTIDCGGLSDSSAIISVPDGFQITGNGKGRTIIYATNTTTTAGANGVDVFRTPSSTTKQLFQGLHFRGTNGTDAASFSYAFNNQNSMICLGYASCYDVVIRDCYFEQLWGFSVHDVNDANERNHVLDCTFVNCANGANVNASWSVQRGNVFDNSEGIETSGQYNVISGNTFKAALGVAITIGGNQTPGQEFPGCVVIGNAIDGSTGVGITVTDGITGAVIANNTVRGCELGGFVLHGGVNAIRNCCIVNNVFDSNCINPGANLVGMDVRDGDGGHLIFGNVSIDSGIPGFAQAFGLSLTVPDCVVFGNLFNGTTIDAQFSTGALRTREAGNVFANNTHQWLNTATRSSDAHTAKTSTDVIFRTRVYNLSSLEDRAYWSIDATGKMRWGDNLNTLVSEGVNLYRNATGVLKTDASFVAVGTLTGSNLSGTNTGDQIAGTGLTGTTTLNVIANADGSIIANANDIQVGVLATDAQHGTRGGGTLHAAATVSTEGFVSATTQTFGGLKRIEASATGDHVFKVQNTHASGFSTSAYYSSGGTLKTVVGYDNSNANCYLQAAGSTNRLILVTDSTARLCVQANGNVLIGSESDASTGKLQVTGDASVTGAITQNAGVSVLDQTNVIGSITNKTFIAAALTGATTATQSTTGAVITVKNTNAAGFSTIAFQDDGGTLRTVVGYDNVNDISYIQAVGALHVVTAGTNRGNITTGGVLAWTGNITMNAGVQVLDQTNVVASISGKTFSSLTHSGTLALGTSTISGTPNFSGAATMNSVALLNQTNVVTAITGKSFSSLTHSGTLALGTSTVSGTPTYSGVQTFQAVNVDPGGSIAAFAGGGQGSATALTNKVNFVSTVASAGDSVKLPTSTATNTITVYNLHATNSLNIFPQSGGAIDGLGTNTAYPLAAGASRTFDGQSATQYRSR